VSLSLASGLIHAGNADGVKVSGSGSATATFTGELQALNKFFTTAGRVQITYQGGQPLQALSVHIDQDGRTSKATAELRAVEMSSVAQGWRDMAVSNGVVVAVSHASGSAQGIYLSRDNGTTWAPAILSPGVSYEAVSVSSDGSTIIALGGGGAYALSEDGGVNWITGRAPSDNYSEVVLLADDRVIASDRTDSSRRFYFRNIFDWGWRTDYFPGEMREMDLTDRSWTEISGEPNANWNAMAVSQDGGRVVAVSGSSSNRADEGAIYLADLGRCGCHRDTDCCCTAWWPVVHRRYVEVRLDLAKPRAEGRLDLRLDQR
jgi:hypothetical protein